MPLVKYFLGEAYKLKKFLIQIKIKITNKELGLLIVIKQVAYVGLFLIKRVLEQFKPYLTKIQLNGMSTTNIKAQYMFLTQDGFANWLKQIFKSLEEELVAKDKLENIQQTISAMAYLPEFQIQATRTNQNKKALIAKYC